MTSGSLNMTETGTRPSTNLNMEAKRLLEVLGTNSDDEKCLTFVMNGEDHTIGNSLRYMIMKNPDVNFCGYNIPHPSENKINLRIQTKDVSAKDVFKNGLNDLNTACEHILKTFEESVELFKNSKYNTGDDGDIKMESDGSDEDD